MTQIHARSERWSCAAWCAGLGGLISIVLVRHITATLVSLNPALLSLVGAILLTGSLLACGLRTTTSWLIAGALLATLLPNSSDALRQAVITHAAAGAGRDDLVAALEQLDDDPSLLVGKKLTVSGTWRAQTPRAWATVSRRIMACCAADAIDVGFDVIPARQVNAPDASWVLVSGVARAFLRNGETRYALVDAAVAIVSEENSGAK